MTFVLHIYICNYYSQSEMEIYMSENDFRKQLLLNEFKTLSKGKNKEEIVPLIFALSQKAKQAGIQFIASLYISRLCLVVIRRKGKTA